MALRFVDALGFAGGFTLGMVQAGFELVGKREMKGGFGVPNCEANRHLLGQSWKTEAIDATQWSVVDAEVVAGNPPCSGFSGMSAKHFRGASSPINHCMWAFVDYAARVRPLVAIFESVQLAFTRPDGLKLMRALRRRLEEHTGEHWTLVHILHNVYSVGGVAHRRRYFWVATRIPFGIEWPHQDRLPVLDDAIGDLEDQPEAWAATPRRANASWWANSRTRDDGCVDGHMSIRAPLVQRVADLLSGVEWQEGEHLARVARRYHDTHGRLPRSWQATEQKVVGSGFNMGFNTPVRWRASDPARVVTGGAMVTALHPRLPRMLTHREIARVMGFPDTWLIEPLHTQPGLSNTWGKGITVDCGRWIGQWLKTSLEETPGSYTGVQIGDREFLIDVTNAWSSNLVQSNSTLKKFKKLLGGNSMTEPEAPPVPVTDGENVSTVPATDTATDVAKGSGRPRPQHTLDQDAQVLAHLRTLEAGASKSELAVALALPENKVYLSLWRLHRDNEIHKTSAGGTARWVAGAAPVVAPAAPTEAPIETQAAAPAEETVSI